MGIVHTVDARPHTPEAVLESLFRAPQRQPEADEPGAAEPCAKLLRAARRGRIAATHKEDLTPEEINKRAEALFR